MYLSADENAEEKIIKKIACKYPHLLRFLSFYENANYCSVFALLRLCVLEMISR